VPPARAGGNRPLLFVTAGTSFVVIATASFLSLPGEAEAISSPLTGEDLGEGDSLVPPPLLLSFGFRTCLQRISTNLR
jgi:hypothetical protein